jgi:hypothetical protein
MPKGIQRSNKEKRKAKQAKQPAAIPASPGITPLRPAGTAPAKKK